MFSIRSIRLGTFEEVTTKFWYDSSYIAPTDQELELHRELMSRWASFAKTGSPNNENYKGWHPVPKVGRNTDGSATQIDQLYFSLDYGGFMSNGAPLTSVIERCSTFPNWIPFSVITESPTYSPTTYDPTLSPTRRPSRRPTKKPSKKPTRQPTKKPSRRPTKRPSTEQPTTPTPTPFSSCEISAGDDLTLSCPIGQFCQLQTGVCLTKSAYWNGICAPIPEVCTADVDEVCGCDDVTYSNKCVAHSIPENISMLGKCAITESPTSAPVEPTPSPVAVVTANPTASPSDKPTVSFCCCK